MWGAAWQPRGRARRAGWPSRPSRPSSRPSRAAVAPPSRSSRLARTILVLDDELDLLRRAPDEEVHGLLEGRVQLVLQGARARVVPPASCRAVLHLHDDVRVALAGPCARRSGTTGAQDAALATAPLRLARRAPFRGGALPAETAARLVGTLAVAAGSRASAPRHRMHRLLATHAQSTSFKPSHL